MNSPFCKGAVFTSVDSSTCRDWLEAKVTWLLKSSFSFVKRDTCSIRKVLSGIYLPDTQPLRFLSEIKVGNVL